MRRSFSRAGRPSVVNVGTMFTGIIQKVGKVMALDRAAGSITSSRLVVRAELGPLSPGESIAVNGVCLTVVPEPGTDAADAVFFLSPETLDRSNLGSLKPGRQVNLERAL